MTTTDREREITELLAKTIYESVFDDRWRGDGIEAALYRQAASNALGVLRRYVLEVAPHRNRP